jgi:hypothetical protein
MIAKQGDRIVLIKPVRSEFSDAVYPPGTEGVIVEVYASPEEGYAVDLSIPDDAQPGGYRYDNVVLSPGQFRVIKKTNL